MRSLDRPTTKEEIIRTAITLLHLAEERRCLAKRMEKAKKKSDGGETNFGNEKKTPKMICYIRLNQAFTVQL